MIEEKPFSKLRSSKYMQLPSNQGRAIPYPQGPYTTGCADLLIGEDVDGSLIRLYYPTDEPDIRFQSKKLWTRWHLGQHYDMGVSIFLFYVPFYTFGILSLLTFIFLRICNFMFGNVLVPALWEAPITKREDSLPVIIFSHGLISNRTYYSGICNDIASNGFLVAAVEHRDQSACATFTLNSEGKKNWILYKKVQKHEEVQCRKKQLKIRARECTDVLDILLQLNQGVKLRNLLRSSFNLESLKGKLDFSKLCMAGQSFGAATTLEILSYDNRFHFGIALDPWMVPLVTTVESVSEKIQTPILFVLNEKFQTKKNISYLKLFQNERNRFYTIKGAVHLNQIDSGMIMARDSIIVKLIAVAYTPRFPSEIPLTINNALVMKYIWSHLDQEPKKQEELGTFLKSEEEHIIRGLHGNASTMYGWRAISVHS